MIASAKRLDSMAFSPVRKVLEKAQELERQGRSIIHFEIGEPDFDTPAEIIAATKQALDDRLTHYGPNRGLLTLRQAISQKLKEENDLTYDPETEILLTTGAAEAILDAILAYVNPGDEVIVFTPAYMNYYNILSMAGATVIEIPLREEDGFQVNPEILEEKITSKTRMLVINDPQNPSGIIYDPQVLEKIAKVVLNYDLIVLSDEIYERITYNGVKHTSIATFPGMKERTLVINGFSKAYAMTGWRVGYLAAAEQLIPPILKVHQYNTTCLPVFVQKGLEQTMNLPSCRKQVSDMVRRFDTRRQLLLAGLREISELSVCEPTGAFYAFVNVSKTGMNGEEFAQKLLLNQGVALVPGSGFGRDFSDYVRISYATSEAHVVEGVQRIRRFVDGMDGCLC